VIKKTTSKSKKAQTTGVFPAVLFSSLFITRALRGTLKFGYLNLGSAVAHIDDINELFKEVDMHVTYMYGTAINVKDGRRGGGVPLFMRYD
jgi:hypothetical protein